MAKLKTGFLCLLKHYEVVGCEGVWLEVIVTSVNKLVDFTYLKDVSNLLIYRGWDSPFTKYHGHASALPKFDIWEKKTSTDFCIRAVFFIGGFKKTQFSLYPHLQFLVELETFVGDGNPKTLLLKLNRYTHRIHVWYIYLHLVEHFMVNVSI